MSKWDKYNCGCLAPSSCIVCEDKLNKWDDKYFRPNTKKAKHCGGDKE